jgi:hypothetical protein
VCEVGVDEKERGRFDSFLCLFPFHLKPPTLGGFSEALTCGVCLQLQASTPRSLKRPHLDAVYSIQVDLNCGNVRQRAIEHEAGATIILWQFFLCYPAPWLFG